MPLRISFDLDDTLICSGEVPCEPKPAWPRRWMVSSEPLRHGARSLFRHIVERGWEPWIYTTSHRPPRSIRRWLRAYGIHVAEIINQDIHLAECPRTPDGGMPSKNPGAFGIHLHVDDLVGVRIEGEQLGFRVAQIDPTDLNWVQRVMAFMEQCELEKSADPCT